MRIKNPVVLLVHGLITLARAFLETIDIDDMHATAFVSDQSGLLESMGDDR